MGEGDGKMKKIGKNESSPENIKIHRKILKFIGNNGGYAIRKGVGMKKKGRVGEEGEGKKYKIKIKIKN